MYVKTTQRLLVPAIRLAQADMLAVGKQYIDQVKNRTMLRGVGTNGTLPPYSPSTIKQRRRSHLQTTYRSLKRTGKMWGAFTVLQAKDNTVTVGWRPPYQRVAEAQDKRTPFLRPARRDKTALVKFFGRALRSSLAGLTFTGSAK